MGISNDLAAAGALDMKMEASQAGSRFQACGKISEGKRTEQHFRFINPSIVVAWIDFLDALQLA